jgi:SAM-dependent methyltransferase
MDIFDYNSQAWDNEVHKGSPWSQPVTKEQVENAREGDFRIILTPTKAVPKDWLGDFRGKRVLCLASGGGQQGPLLAAAGAKVTVFDNSPEQLKRDAFVAERDQLEIELVRGNMQNLSVFESESFDLIVHPCSNCFVPDIRPVWRESFRVLKAGGSLLSGFNNPISYCWDRSLFDEAKILQMKYSLPYSDLTSLTDEERKVFTDRGEPLEFGHSLEDQIGGQTGAGFHIAGFYEDKWGNGELEDQFFPHFMATRALKPLKV